MESSSIFFYIARPHPFLGSFDQKDARALSILTRVGLAVNDVDVFRPRGRLDREHKPRARGRRLTHVQGPPRGHRLTDVVHLRTLAAAAARAPRQGPVRPVRRPPAPRRDHGRGVPSTGHRRDILPDPRDPRNTSLYDGGLTRGPHFESSRVGTVVVFEPVGLGDIFGVAGDGLVRVVGDVHHRSR